jgi:hypothetical protein
MDATWVRFRSYPAMIHAELAKSALEAYGIDAAILGSSMRHQREIPGFSIDLMVRREDVGRARDIPGSEEAFST